MSKNQKKRLPALCDIALITFSLLSEYTQIQIPYAPYKFVQCVPVVTLTNIIKIKTTDICDDVTGVLCDFTITPARVACQAP